MAQLRDKYEEELWTFFEQHVVPAILKYQTTNCANQREDFEYLLLQAVKQEPVSVVSLTL